MLNTRSKVSAPRRAPSAAHGINHQGPEPGQNLGSRTGNTIHILPADSVRLFAPVRQRSFEYRSATHGVLRCQESAGNWPEALLAPSGCAGLFRLLSSR